MTNIDNCDLTNTEWYTKAAYSVKIEAKEYADAYPKGLWVGWCAMEGIPIKLWWDLRGNCVMFKLPEKIQISITKEEFDLKTNTTRMCKEY